MAASSSEKVLCTQIKSYMIYNPVYRQIKKYIKRKTGQRNFIVNTWNVCLYARDDILDMKLVWVRVISDEFIQFIDKLVSESDCFFPWRKFPNIVVAPKNYDRLKDFIGNNKLWKYVEKIETKTNMAIVRSTIKVITFHPRIRKNNILATFKQKETQNFYGCFYNLYIAQAYDWLTPAALKHLDIKIRYRYTHVVIYLLLDYYRKLRRRRNIRVLNLFDLCSLRLAMFDPRYYQFDQCEIPSLIHEELSETIESKQKVNKNFVFNSTAYLIKNDVQAVPRVVAQYFMFYVSTYNDDIEIVPCNVDLFTAIIYVKNYVRVYTEDFYGEYLIDFIGKRPHFKLSIVGSSVAMNTNLILKLMSFSNVSSVTIDTNFPIVFDKSESNEMAIVEHPLAVSFCGANENRTMENCLTHLKTFLKFRPYSLYINCPLSNYSIFNDIPASNVSFFQHELTAKMISNLKKTELTETSYDWLYATLANDPTVLGMLYDFPLVENVGILQDEYTFELIFRFIEQQIRMHNLTEFNFNRSYTVHSELESDLNLNNYTFRVNEFHSKIEMFDKISCEVVDLYELLHSAKSDEIDFEFYQ